MIFKRKRFLVLMVLSMFILTLLPAKETPPKIVTTQWLKENLAIENLRILDVRENIREYWKKHIPGAVYCHPEIMRLADKGIPGKMMPPKAFAIMLGQMGITPKTHVVVYAEKSDFKPSYLVWILDYLEHPASSILDGGLEKWEKENLPITQDYPKISGAIYPLPGKFLEKIRANLEEVENSLGNKDFVLLDVRTKKLYTGEEGFWKRNGHIKGAINHFWSEDIDEKGVWKDKETLKDTYTRLGATPDKTIIVSCGQGQMSSHAYITLKYILNYPRVKNYDGSFSEWAYRDDLPVETGDK